MTSPSNSQWATIRDVAAEAKLLTSSVSLFIRGRSGIGNETAQKVASAIDKLNYEPLSPTKSKTKNKIIGLLHSQLPMPAFSDVVCCEISRGLEATAKEHGFGVLFSITEDEQLPPMVAENQVSALLILDGSSTNDTLDNKFGQREIPLVLIDNYIAS